LEVSKLTIISYLILEQIAVFDEQTGSDIANEGISICQEIIADPKTQTPEKSNHLRELIKGALIYKVEYLNFVLCKSKFTSVKQAISRQKCLQIAVVGTLSLQLVV
jgi:hypothetical protein